MSTPANPFADAIAANISALEVTAANLTERIHCARIAIRDGNRNRAIGNLMDLDRLLPEAEALYRAVMLLHRRHD